MKCKRAALSAVIAALTSACAIGATGVEQGSEPEPVLADAGHARDAADETDPIGDASDVSAFDAGPSASGEGAGGPAAGADAGSDAGRMSDAGAASDAGRVLDAGTTSDAGARDSGRSDASMADAGAPIDLGAGGGFAYTPSNVDLTGIDLNGAPIGTLNCGVTEIDTSGSVTIRNWCGTAPTPIVRAQTGGPELVVVPLKGFAVQADNTLRVSGTRPIVLLVHGSAVVRGSVDASARSQTPGPGGNDVCGTSVGRDGTGNAGSNGAGGGGGGHGSRGGNGGESGNATPGAGGAARGNTDIRPLIAGCPGGKAGGGCPGNPGAGGGALQISVGGALTVSGVVQARGGNGANGCSNDSGGTGAGSGGSILLEGATIDATGGMIGAAGGQGGEGQSGGDGGEGATIISMPGENGGNSGASGGGGGGGGSGRVKLRAMGTCTGMGC